MKEQGPLSWQEQCGIACEISEFESNLAKYITDQQREAIDFYV
ncbi:hypothetical protein NBRC116593_37440 [Sulfitobacter pacificus]